MAQGAFRFDRFSLDPANRTLSRDDVPVELNARYFDALVLLVREKGALISKERFLNEVWRGTPVTDESLTQCVRTLRRQLGDDASNPHLIETVPKHGYRFIAPVTWVEMETGSEGPSPVANPPAEAASASILRIGLAGAIGGGGAGAIGGVLYGALAAGPELGAASALVVLIAVTTLVGLLGGAGVGVGVGAALAAPGRLGQSMVLGGAMGGMLVGGAVKLIGLDAFALLIGETPGEITGGAEGAVLGAAGGLCVWVMRGWSVRRILAIAGAAGATAGLVIHLLGGRLMAGSLDLLAQRFPQSRLELDRVGGLLGEPGFGPTAQLVTCALEGGLFVMCVVAAMIVARRGADLRRAS